MNYMRRPLYFNVERSVLFHWFWWVASSGSICEIFCCSWWSRKCSEPRRSVLPVLQTRQKKQLNWSFEVYLRRSRIAYIPSRRNPYENQDCWRRCFTRQRASVPDLSLDRFSVAWPRCFRSLGYTHIAAFCPSFLLPSLSPFSPFRKLRQDFLREALADHPGPPPASA